MLHLHNLARVEARRGPGAPSDRSFDGSSSLYGTAWETCEGSQGMDADAARDLIDGWIEFDTHEDPAHGKFGPVTEYRYVPGFVLDDHAWHQAEELMQRQLTPADVVDFINNAEAHAATDDMLAYATGA